MPPLSQHSRAGLEQDPPDPLVGAARLPLKAANLLAGRPSVPLPTFEKSLVLWISLPAMAFRALRPRTSLMSPRLLSPSPFVHFNSVSMSRGGPYLPYQHSRSECHALICPHARPRCRKKCLFATAVPSPLQFLSMFSALKTPVRSGFPSRNSLQTFLAVSWRDYLALREKIGSNPPPCRLPIATRSQKPSSQL